MAKIKRAVKLKSMNFSGIITALATPFLRGEPDKDSFLNLLDFQVRQGVTHFVLNSTTGEGPVLEEGELETLTEWFRHFEKSRGLSLKLMMGTGTFSTKKTVEKTKQAESLGANSALIVTPYYNRPSMEGLFQHYKKITEAVSLPVILYNVPSRTAVTFDTQTLKRLSEIPNIKGIKEATGDMTFFKEIRKTCGEDFQLLSGDDFSCVESFLSGGNGVISAVGNVLGGKVKELFERSKKKDLSVREDFKRFLPFLKALYKETNPLGVKQALALLGIISSPETRLPLVNPPPSPELKKELEIVKKALL